jgi:hypothetical protein
MPDADTVTRTVWEISFAQAWDDAGTEEGDHRNRLLSDGWEPFAVSGRPTAEVMWFRRIVK